MREICDEHWELLSDTLKRRWRLETEHGRKAASSQLIVDMTLDIQRGAK